MLAPAIRYKNKIMEEFQKLVYTDDMMLVTGCLEQWIPKIPDNPGQGEFNYAIVDSNDNCIGYFAFQVDYYARKAYNFGLMSFDRGNPIVGLDVFHKLEELVKYMHRVEWRAVEGNPACRGYDKFISIHGGNKIILRDSVRDKYGNYRDDFIYEIVNKGGDLYD